MGIQDLIAAAAASTANQQELEDLEEQLADASKVYQMQSAELAVTNEFLSRAYSL